MTTVSTTNVCTLGEIRMVGFSYAPKDWVICDGATIPTATYMTLYSLLGNTYGGDSTVFKLPNLMGRVPVAVGPNSSSNNYRLGYDGGYETISLGISDLPEHTHSVAAIKEKITTAMPCCDQPFGNISDPSGAYPSMATAMYSSESPDTAMAPTQFDAIKTSTVDVANAGSSQPHNNMQPYLVINYIICVTGNYPLRN